MPPKTSRMSAVRARRPAKSSKLKAELEIPAVPRREACRSANLRRPVTNNLYPLRVILSMGQSPKRVGLGGAAVARQSPGEPLGDSSASHLPLRGDTWVHC